MKISLNDLISRGRVKIHLFKSLVLAFPFTIAFYILILPFKGTMLYTLFYERHMMPYLCTYCSWLALMLLFFRWWEHKKDFDSVAALESHLTTTGKITPDNALSLSRELENDRAFTAGDLTYSRFSRLMRHVKSGSSWAETESLVKGMETFDMDAIESAYGWVRFLIWLIPILGFIGTVLGIGQAIGGFNVILTGTESFDAMKGSLGGITDSLAYAFDSTLVALLQDAFIMFIISMIQKQGDDLLIRLNEVFTDDVLVRIEHSDMPGGGAGLAMTPEGMEVLNRFSESAEKLTALAKLDSFEGTLMDIKESLARLSPILANLQKKRALHFKLEEVQEES
jgi:biopolymer transport protein ExbB/TolQ